MKAFGFNSTVVRLTAAAVVAFLFLLAGFVVIWTIANTSAESVNQKEVAILLTELSPGDPLTHKASAVLHERAFEPGDLEIALAEFEKAAAAAPNNYIFWLLLGSAETRAGEYERAEVALTRAKLLAPNYSRVQWALGNLLLRQGRDEEGYAEIQRAVHGDPSLSAPAVTVAMQLSDNDMFFVRDRFKDSPEALVHLVIALVKEKRFADAREMWRTSAVRIDTERLKEASKLLMQRSFEARQYRLAAEVFVSKEVGNSSMVGRVTNPGFEEAVRAQSVEGFEWRVPQTNFPQYAITDAQKLSGGFSLLTFVNTSDAKEFQGIAQTIAVEPERVYEFSLAYRSDLNSKAEHFWEIRSASDSKQIAVTTALVRSNVWSKATVGFTVPKDTDGIEIRLVRGPCAGSVCAATGSIWFDDFSLVGK